jgi:hypothetical protein
MTKDRVKRTLQVLIGLPLQDIGRAAGIVWVHFGKLREVPAYRGGMKNVGTYALHVQCAWRLTGSTGIVTGDRDMFLAAGDDPFTDDEAFDWSVPGSSRCDERLRIFFQHQEGSSLIVESVHQVDNIGSFQLILSKSYRLEIFPNDSLDGLDNEYWRLFQPGTKQPHFVVTGKGVEIEEDTDTVE